MITNSKKLIHTCGIVAGTGCGIWSVKIYRLYFYCSDIGGWHFRWLQRKPKRRLYGGFIRIHTAFGVQNCTCSG